MQLLPTVHKLLSKQANNGTILVLPTELVLRSTHAQPIHYQCLGWTTKKNEPSGRVTGDMSYTTWPTSLNGTTKEAKDDVRQQVEDKWGKITLPTLEDIAHDILLMADAEGWDKQHLPLQERHRSGLP